MHELSRWQRAFLACARRLPARMRNSLRLTLLRWSGWSLVLYEALAHEEAARRRAGGDEPLEYGADAREGTAGRGSARLPDDGGAE